MTKQPPNTLWCADFKGEFKLGNGRYCYPLAATNLRPPGAFKLDNGVLVTFCQPCLRDGHRSDSLFGAGEGIRTLDPNLGKVVLYP